MSQKKSYPVGSIIISGGLAYQVKQGDSCQGCAFFIASEAECVHHHNECGECSDLLRPDDISVIFQCLGEAEEITPKTN